MEEKLMTLLKELAKIKAPFTEKFLLRVIEKAVSQDEFGLKKYNQYLNPMDSYDWLNMAFEEYVDLGKYIEAERYRRDNTLLNILRNINRMRSKIEKNRGNFNPQFIKDMIMFLDVLEVDIKSLSRNLDGMEEGKASKE